MSAILSQMAVFADSDGFEFLETPVGPQPLPRWVKGASINWWPGYAMHPCLIVKVVPDYDPDMDPVPYTEEKPGHYIARFPDGRVRQWYHASPLIEMDVEDRFLGWGRKLDDWGNRERLCTTVRKLVTREVHEGLGGSPISFDLRLPSGEVRPCQLRGPWHICPPSGVNECSAAPKRWSRWPLAITDDLFLRIMARFHPWHRVARVKAGPLTRLEPVHSSWDAPKLLLPRGHPHRLADPDKVPLAAQVA